MIIKIIKIIFIIIIISSNRNRNRNNENNNAYKNHWNSLDTIIHYWSPNTRNQKIVNSVHSPILITHGNLASTEKETGTVVLNVLMKGIENDGKTTATVTNLSVEFSLARLEDRKSSNNNSHH